MKKLLPLLLLLLLLWGCSALESDTAATNDEIAAACLELGRGLSALDPADTQELLDFFGESGKCAVDSENTFQMTCPEVVFQAFAPDGSLNSGLEVYSVFPDGSFTRFDLRGGKVLLTHLYLSGTLPVVSRQEEYALTGARLTKKQSLLFTYDIPQNPESKYAHDGYIVPCTLLKTVAPDPDCARLCEKYIPPRCYERCDLLSSDWSAEDCSALGLSGMYDRLFCLSTGKNLWDAGSGAATDELTGELSVREEDLISLLSAYLPISAEALRQRSEYDGERGEFRLSIPSDQSLLDVPRPKAEVTDYTQNSDGSLTLTVDEVFLDRGSDCLCRSDLTIMPAADGSFKYVSNRVIIPQQ